MCYVADDPPMLLRGLIYTGSSGPLFLLLELHLYRGVNDKWKGIDECSQLSKIHSLNSNLGVVANWVDLVFSKKLRLGILKTVRVQVSSNLKIPRTKSKVTVPICLKKRKIE